MINKLERFIYRYRRAKDFIDELIVKEEELFSSTKNLTLKEKDDFCLALKFAYEYCWKTMKDFLKSNNVIEHLPRKIIVAMCDFDLNPTYWLQFIDEINEFFIFRQSHAPKDLIIENYFKYYKDMFKNFDKQMSLIVEKTEVLTIEKDEYVNENHYVIDTKAFYLLTDNFLKYPTIEEAHLYGSRVDESYRKSSDIDLILKGSFTFEEYKNIKYELENLKLPYIIDIHSSIDTEEEFIKTNLYNSIIIYKKSDFE